MESAVGVTEFWDDVFSRGQEDAYSRVEMPDLCDPILNRALAHFGDIEDRTLVDLGCGSGATSFGSMVLHHIEPFDEFAEDLRNAVKPGGRGFFWENSARCRMLIWFRENIVGRLWVPKEGDPDESPLTPGEVDEIRKYFHVEI